MPTSPTYPGVYIEEVPSGVRTIAGVATSITAFIGRAARGPVNEPTTIASFADFERRFGGVWEKSMLGYAVRDFFLNGGTEAIIVRLAHDEETATVTLDVDASPVETLVLEAASPGDWGNNLFVTVDHDTEDPTAPVSSPPEATDTTHFNLKVEERVDGEVRQAEQFLNVSLEESSASYLPRVLEESSSLIRVGKETDGTWQTWTGRPSVTDENGEQAEDGEDGDDLETEDYCGDGTESGKTGLYALEKADLFNLLCIPPPQRDGDTDPSVYQAALSYCVKRRALLIVDPPLSWGASAAEVTSRPISGLSALGLTGKDARNAALYFPRVKQPDPNLDQQTQTFVPCGIIAGVMARTDAQRGVWKAPAGLDASLNGIQGLQANLTDAENGKLNPLGINCLRAFPVNGRVVWGARTLRGADQLADEYKYIPVRRMALFLEESLYRGTQWVVFEPNDEPLWAQIRLNIGAFMHNLFRQGAFQGKTPAEAYLVKCDKETTTQNDINLGIVNILVGFAPLKPAEFVIIKIQQLAGQIAT